ncbi:MAG: TonB-dependent siderophore receptor [Proteobacteria bacterium]|nr:TonB-dependent siderophore receptor [Pseudomonadota bacterium]
MSRKSKIHFLVISATTALYGADFREAYAQDATPTQTPSVGTMPAVTVEGTAWRAWEPVTGYVAPVTTTGTKTDTPLIEAPQSIGVVTRDQMTDQGAQSVSSALRYTAGVLSEVRPSSRYDSVFVRGFGGGGTQAAFVNFLDGLRMGRGVNFAVPTVEPYLLERIEVLRGPASVLYGQTGAGGIVNLVSKRPLDVPLYETNFEFGSYSLFQSSFDFSGPLTKDGKYLYRLTGLGRLSGTQYDYIGEERYAIAPAFTWKPSADTTLTILGNYQTDPKTGFYNFTPGIGSVIYSPYGKIHSNFFGGDPNWQVDRRTQYGGGYQFEHRFDNTFTVRQNFRYQHIDSERKVVSIQSIAADGRTANRGVLNAVEGVDTLAIDTQGQAIFDTGPLRHTFLVGFDWSWSNSLAQLGQITGRQVPTLDIFNPTYFRSFPYPTLGAAQTTGQTTNQYGIYFQDQVKFGNWRLNLGLRQDWATSQQVAHATGAVTPQNDSAVTWRTGLLYLFDFGLAPYFSYSTSFLPNAGASAPQRGTVPFKPTTGEQYEAGIKYQPPGFNSFFQVAAFQITQRNVLTPDPIYPTFNIATGEIRSRGIEVEAHASLTDGLDLIANYAYTNAIVTETNQPGVTGAQVPQVPNHMASLWGHYRFQKGALRGLSLGGGVRYVGPSYGNNINTFEVPGVTLFDAAVRYNLGALNTQLEHVDLSLNIQNIADTEYVASCSSETLCYFGNRRLIMGGLHFKW